MIYLVEDDDATRKAIGLLLECEALEACAFPSCDDLCQKTDPTSADCLILDVHMRGTTGLELLERVRRNDRCPPVILMSGRVAGDILARATAAGVFAVLEKPFSGTELIETIKRAIAGRPLPAGPASRGAAPDGGSGSNAT